MAIVVLIAAAGCKKGDNFEKSSPQEKPIARIIGSNPSQIGKFSNSQQCQRTGDLDACCPIDPTGDCCRCPVVVTPGLYGAVLSNINSNDEVASFFSGNDWQTFFPQLLEDSETLEDLQNGHYSLIKYEYGDKVYCKFYSESDQFILVLNLVE